MYTIERIAGSFSVCKLRENEPFPEAPFVFTAVTDSERSLVCRAEDVPEKTLSREDGYGIIRFAGSLDFSLVGVLSRICTILADARIGIFAISTFDTDYILIKQTDIDRAVKLLSAHGYAVL